VRFLHGDFVALAPEIAPADIVTLDRVICCYPDMERLVAASASRARRLYGAVFPRESWLLKLAFTAGNLLRRLRGSAFRTYLHSTGAIDSAVQRQGLRQRSVRDTFLWRVAVYARSA
jgi:magnesium-protoporphyrin O-methyltransferase